MATKKRIHAAIAERLAAKPGLRRENVQVTPSSNERDEWSFGIGLASYVQDTPPTEAFPRASVCGGRSGVRCSGSNWASGIPGSWHAGPHRPGDASGLMECLLIRSKRWGVPQPPCPLVDQGSRSRADVGRVPRLKRGGAPASLRPRRRGGRAGCARTRGRGLPAWACRRGSPARSCSPPGRGRWPAPGSRRPRR